MLPRCWNEGEGCGAVRRLKLFVEWVNVCVVTSSSRLPDFKFEFITPNTDMKEGKAAGNGEEPAWIGILGWDDPSALRLMGTVRSRPLDSSTIFANTEI
jgi:hypothetical protein